MLPIQGQFQLTSPSLVTSPTGSSGGTVIQKKKILIKGGNILISQGFFLNYLFAVFWFHETFQIYINYRPVNSTVDGLDASSSLRNITLSFPYSLQYDMMLIDWFDQKKS